MNKVSSLIVSSKSTLLLLVLAIIAMGAGTFVEDHFTTEIARDLIYNTFWFEALFVLLALNFIGHIAKFKMVSKAKFSGLIFHLAFIVIIIGAGLTRYFGYEGQMHIREGDASNTLYSTENYFGFGFGDSIQQLYKLHFNAFYGQKFFGEVKGSSGEKITYKVNSYLPNAKETFHDNIHNGSDFLEIYAAGINGKERVIVPYGSIVPIGKTFIDFNDSARKQTLSGIIRVKREDGEIKITPPLQMQRTIMAQQHTDTLFEGHTYVFTEMCLYQMGESTLMFKKYHRKAIKTIEPCASNEEGTQAVLLGIKVNDKEHEIPILFESGQVMDPKTFNFDGVHVTLGYGRKPIELPFSLYLRQFILERYAGSESPSSYASEVTVIDPSRHAKFEHRIFMNNVLDYRGYRFFQSSYDKDEKGTILSVNHDFYGTWMSYLGYSLLGIGFVATLFNRNSRFLMIRKIISKIRQERRNLLVSVITISSILVTSYTNSATAQEQAARFPIPQQVSDAFGNLVVQVADGRFEPMNTLAYDALHKISRKDHFDFPETKQMDPVQLILGMIIQPEYWKTKSIVYIKEQSVRDVLGIKSTACAFIDFFDNRMKYKLQEPAETAFRKKPSEQNAFDKEIIKLDERANVFMMLFEGSLIKVFPDPYGKNHKWMSWEEQNALYLIPSQLKEVSEVLNYPNLTPNLIWKALFSALAQGSQTGDYGQSLKLIAAIKALQTSSNEASMIPSETKIAGEVFYNKANIFVFLRNAYGLLSVFILLFAFIENVQDKPSRFVKVALGLGIILLGLGFLYQTFGMLLRAYLLGYAPWSNGYEALLLVAWGTLLAGFSFARYSKITLAATSLLAFFVLMTASHSSYDPQMTNLTPVLKSYWLIIHVAVLTISYAFLGLGFILGLINLVVYLFIKQTNSKRLLLVINELTFINEMNLTIGLALATIGTFLGGVWANESWGRYWSWDAKETWALVIVITYTLVLHLRFIPQLCSKLIFNIAAILSFASVLMTFFGVNYFLSKGMHSYGAGDKAIFPLWAWLIIIAVLSLILSASFKEHQLSKQLTNSKNQI